MNVLEACVLLGAEPTTESEMQAAEGQPILTVVGSQG